MPRATELADLRSHGSGHPAKVSVVVLTYNEQTNLPECLESLSGLRCDVFVVDSGSTDRTLEIAKAFGASISTHPFENYAAQRNWALKHLPFTTDWILHLDADERLTRELVNEINIVVAVTAPEVAGLMLRKRTIFMGRWIRHGGHYPSFHLRLLRNGKGRCEDRLYDQHFLADGRIERLKSDYMDIVSSNLASWSVRHVRWADLEASEMLAFGERGNQVHPVLTGNPIQRRRWWRRTYGTWPLFVRALCYWFYRYIGRAGFLDGKEGLIFHFLQGFWFRFLVDAMIYERRQERAALKNKPQAFKGAAD